MTLRLSDILERSDKVLDGDLLSNLFSFAFKSFDNPGERFLILITMKKEIDNFEFHGML